MADLFQADEVEEPALAGIAAIRFEPYEQALHMLPVRTGGGTGATTGAFAHNCHRRLAPIMNLLLCLWTINKVKVSLFCAAVQIGIASDGS